MSAAEMKNCPYCDESIRAVAKKCRYCGEILDEDFRPRKKSPGAVDRMLVPVGRPISAIAAGYCALFGIIPMLGLPFSIAAVVCGVVALKSINANRELSGKGRAWFGIILGTIEIVFLLVMVTIILAEASSRRRF